jgi:hypothetical protein
VARFNTLSEEGLDSTLCPRIGIVPEEGLGN